MKTVAALLCGLVLVIMLAACGGQAANVLPASATAQPAPLEIIEVGELDPYRGAAVKGDTGVTWSDAGTEPAPASADATTMRVQSAIKAEASRLAAVDYSKLSIPNYITITKTLKLTPGDFTGDKIRLDATGKAGQDARWALYAWQGPEFPQLPGRDMVFRWVTVYALYDLHEDKVVRLVATVRGQVLE